MLKTWRAVFHGPEVGILDWVVSTTLYVRAEVESQAKQLAGEKFLEVYGERPEKLGFVLVGVDLVP